MRTLLKTAAIRMVEAAELNRMQVEGVKLMDDLIQGMP